MTAPRRRELPAAKRERLAQVDDPQVVLDAALRFLETRQRSIAEVRRRLTSAGYRPELVDGAVTRLTELGILDDTAFARAWVESRDRAHPRGEHALRRELSLKGIDRATIEEVLSERRDGASQEADMPDPDEVAAERLLERKLPALLREPDPRRRLQKAYALLARNGFAPDVCSSVARRVLANGITDPLSAT